MARLAGLLACAVILAGQAPEQPILLADEKQPPPGGATGLPAFPGAIGFGAGAAGARGCPGTPRVLVVDTLEDQDDGGCDAATDSPGNCSLRDALTTTGPRYVVANVSGPARLKKRLRLGPSHSCLTVNFSTAPAPVYVTSHAIELVDGFHEGIFRYLYVRPGGEFVDEDQGLTGPHCTDVVARCAGHRDEPVAAPAGACPGPGDDAACARKGRGHCAVFLKAELDPTDPEANTCGPGRDQDCTRCGSDCFGFRTRGGRRQSLERAAVTARRMCNDVVARRHSTTDGFAFRRNVQRVIVDHASVEWAHDETIAFGASRPSSRLHEIGVTRSIIGNGVKGDSDNHVYGHLERHHNTGILLGFPRHSQADPRSIQDITLARNYVVNNHARSPRILGGTGEFINNIVYNSGVTPTIIAARKRGTAWDFLNNYYRHGPDFQKPGMNTYCTGGTSDGRPCLRNEHCPPAGVGSCDDAHDHYFNIGGGDIQPRVFLSGNEFYDTTNTRVTNAIPGAELDTQWDRARRSEHRPLRKDDPFSGTAYGARRTERIEEPTFPVPLLPAMELPDELLPNVGASLPCRDSRDRDLVAAFHDGTGYIPPQRYDPTPEGGFKLPSVSGEPYRDADEDGMDDAWETLHGVDDPLADPDGDGYPNVEEWMNGTDPKSTRNVDTRSVEACTEEP